VSLFHPCDVTRVTDVESLVEWTVEQLGRLDVLVNSAGVVGPEGVESSLDEWNAALEVNLTGVMLSSRAAARVMDRLGNGGAIISISSVASLTGMSGRLAYSASKAAVNRLTQCLAVEWGGKGIRVNAIAPGFLNHAMQGNEDRLGQPEFKERLVRATPLGRLGEPSELVGPVLFLASSASSFVTGATLLVDGGYVAKGTESE
jgi:NAD(P)-dependent dehydrogenase (short-subunit alcohol dehydrogenase family)